MLLVVGGIYTIWLNNDSWFCHYCNNQVLCPLVINKDTFHYWTTLKYSQDFGNHPINLVFILTYWVSFSCTWWLSAWGIVGVLSERLSTWLKWAGAESCEKPASGVGERVWSPRTAQSVKCQLASGKDKRIIGFDACPWGPRSVFQFQQRWPGVALVTYLKAPFLGEQNSSGLFLGYSNSVQQGGWPVNCVAWTLM